MSKQKSVLVLASHYSPNIGGVETHLSDLVTALRKKNWNVYVATYKPLAISKKAKIYEKSDKLTVYRFPWIGFNIVHKLTPYPPLEFLYLFPGLFLLAGFVLFLNPNLKTIHAQGLVPGVIGLIWAKLLGKRIIMSTHNLYFFPKTGLYRTFSNWVLSAMDYILCLSNQSAEEIKSIGVPSSKVKPYRYWLDLNLFKKVSKDKAKKDLKINGKMIFFVGRLIETKGVKILLELAKQKLFLKINFVFAGVGPLSNEIVVSKKKSSNIQYVGPLRPEQVKLYMNAADLVAVPSLVDEGYGRVAMEAIACGTPVLAANRGGLDEAVSAEVGMLAQPDTEEFGKALHLLINNPKKLANLSAATERYAKKNFSEENVQMITSYYLG
jgi:glycosyltransferase involved in cell wall biosynthesis